jgi:hypothetical protein
MGGLHKTLPVFPNNRHISDHSGRRLTFGVDFCSRLKQKFDGGQVAQSGSKMKCRLAIVVCIGDGVEAKEGRRRWKEEERRH